MVTMFADTVSVSEPFHVELDSVLNAIKNGRFKNKIDEIRNEKDDAKRRLLKSKLPCVCFCGEFANGIEKVKDDRTFISYRDDKSLTKHSGLVPIDLDNVEDIEKAKDELKSFPFIYALWLSSSGKGIHGLVKIGDPNKHSQHYRALLSKIPGLDATAQNVSRILYVSSDENIYINKSCETFYDIEQEKEKKAVYHQGDGGTDFKKIDIACRMIKSISPSWRFYCYQHCRV